MHRQVGDLIIDSQGIAKKGLLIRHLVLPDNLQGSEEIMRFLSHEISKDTYINIMAQYRPCWQAFKEQSLSRSPTWQEMKEVYALAKREGLWRFDK
jgi:putative pyruvate formate lyase activating enzyme